MIKVQYLQQAPTPAPRPPVTAELCASIDRVEIADVKQDSKPTVKQVKQGEVFDSKPVVKQSEPVSTQTKRKLDSVRSTPESFRSYHREYQRRRRAGLKVDRVSLAKVDP